LHESVVAAHDHSINKSEKENVQDLPDDILFGKLRIAQHFEIFFTVLKYFEDG
jgi:hypothetical protein